jgi:hypothetical protein
MTKFQLSLLILAWLAAAALVMAQSGQDSRGGAPSTGKQAAHVFVTPDKLTWRPARPVSPPAYNRPF